MKVLAAFLAVCVTSTTLVSASPHSSSLGHHARLARKRNDAHVNNLTRRCKTRKPPKAPEQEKPAENNNNSGGDKGNSGGDKGGDKGNSGGDKGNSGGDKGNSGGDKGNSGGDKGNSGGGGGGGGGGLLWTDGPCGSSNPTKDITATSGPNGNMDFFNCGIEGGGWNPPYISVNQIKAVDLREALKDGNSPFHACQKFLGTFEKYAWELGLPPIVLASIAMQESSCNPNTVGGGGEQGLMQITPEKCGGAPGGNCKDPEFNIRTGARYLANTLKEDGGNVVLSVGRYNGWKKGMTKADATHAANIGYCRNQNNLDYMQQMFNGWFQNRNAYDHKNRLGKYFNLDRCN